MDPLASASAPQSGARAVPTGTPREISSDFETFLKLLTAQIGNQDPMDPMKSEEFAVQLATFSNVEQSVKTNELLEAMLSGGGTDTFTAISGWIGHEARAPMPVAFREEPVRLAPDRPAEGSRHELVVKNASGAEVYRGAIDTSGAPVAWDGRLSGGGRARTGDVFTFAVESFERGTLVNDAPCPSYARIVEVRQSGEGPTVAFAGGIEIPASKVTAVRSAGDAI